MPTSIEDSARTISMQTYLLVF